MLQELTKARLPFVSILTDPTMGGVSASFAFVGDVVIAEPGALIGFAGPRVIEQTVREKLPEGFQRAEFLLEKGALDMIVDRRQMRDELAHLLAAADAPAGPGVAGLEFAPTRFFPRAPSPTPGMTRPATLDGWLAYLETLHPKAIALGLERVRAVARPARASRSTARSSRVGGTNGKGSTCAMLEAILRRGGYRVGSIPRRTCCATTSACASTDGEATDAQLLAAFDAVEDARVAAPDAQTRRFRSRISSSARWRRCGCSREPDSTRWCSKSGLGGRLDAVNVVDADVAVLTSVDIDHVDYLGDTREAIGREKAGIFRAGRPAVCADPDPPAA